VKSEMSIDFNPNFALGEEQSSWGYTQILILFPQLWCSSCEELGWLTTTEFA